MQCHSQVLTFGSVFYRETVHAFMNMLYMTGKQKGKNIIPLIKQTLPDKRVTMTAMKKH